MITVIKRILLQDLRLKSNYIYFLIMPVSLMVILGLVLQSVFATQLDATVNPVHVQYVVKDAQQAKLVKQLVTKTKVAHLDFTPRASTKVAQAYVRNHANTAAVTIEQAHIQVATAKNLNDYQNALLKGTLAELAQTLGLVKTAIHYQRPIVTVKSAELVTVNRAQVQRSATSFQYYALAMMGMFMLYFAEIGLDMFGKARRQQTLARELLTPISKGQLLNATVAGHLLYGLLVIAVLMGITAGLFQMPWLRALPFAFANFASLMALFLVLGLALETVAAQLGEGVMQIVIQLVAFLGGGYFPTSTTMMAFSPLGWVMGPLRSALWTSNPLNWSGVWLSLSVTAGLLGLINVVMRRREVF
ncbi:ABC transporter permease [Lactiplantibacillus fabifermentans]|uniref:ABC transporter n=1 Tax=Lactiplantibacillus fabifermentans T30PCM01 TaxID=1400520 RepID=W6T770_9LACO|nr:ABC transporter permease [Lactiplantibacillus fabifermentans]ETY73994.1 ABC transporter [Lactiplantibacillus fabifermentans T30PCM01]